ncbi:hypothetical protein CSB69_0696 [Morganella morganii]|nr:hypothetical protein CSB69_0696 [Morganella morganii]
MVLNTTFNGLSLWSPETGDHNGQKIKRENVDDIINTLFITTCYTVRVIWMW